jgi:phosphoserine phosphatase RsbU/P
MRRVPATRLVRAQLDPPLDSGAGVGLTLNLLAASCMQPCGHLFLAPGDGRRWAGGVEMMDPDLVVTDSRLSGIRSIADAGLSRLDDEEVLRVLLRRTRAILRADSAAVLLLDTAGRVLTATAADGLEEEVYQGVRIPLGKGFAGRIAAEGSPVILDRVDRTTVVNPILLAKGFRALLGVPLIADGKVIGVLHVGSLTDRRFTDSDAELLQLAAVLAATAVQSALARDDRIAAAALQRSLLPSALPAADGAELAARYVPGNGPVGGDWYDVFALPSGEMGLVMGDVAGSGLAAAVIMGRMRSALRAYALQTSDPAEVLARLDRKIQHFEPGALATVLYAVASPHREQLRISSAGHLPPVIAHPGLPAELLAVEADLLIGAAPGTARQVTTIATRPGTVVCFYTDGLIERRGEPLDDAMKSLCQVVTPAAPEAVCSAVMAAKVGAEAALDDIALLVLRRR